MFADGFYVARRVLDAAGAGAVRVVPRCHEGLEDALTGGGGFGFDPRKVLVVRYSEGSPAELFVPDGCCYPAVGRFTSLLEPVCPTCNEQLHGSGPVFALPELERFWGLPVSLVSKLTVDAVYRHHRAVKDHLELVRLSPHLAALADPVQSPIWLAAYGPESGLYLDLLKVMVSTGSVLDVHRDAARVLARRVAPYVRAALPELSLDGTLHSVAGLAETVVELAEL